jgi:hypothetical protein
MKMLAVLFTWVTLSCPCIARTITVDDDGPADFNNIFEAIYDACDGDTVIVADGTYTGPYNNDLDFRGKAITLRSESGPENCIIDCTGGGRGFYFQSGEDANSVLDGFTITNGIMLGGGGIRCKLSSPTISNCIITGNHAGAFAGTGGGIGCVMSSPIITNCTIVGNSANGGGGGIYGYKSDLVINNSSISENSAGFSAGILCDEDCNLTISNCTITRNKDGGIWCNGNLTITNSTISNHSTTGPGGGIYCYGGLTITDCTIRANTASWGGGICCGAGNSTITNCDISGNLAEGDYGGGGVLCSGPGSLEITNSTIIGNRAEWGGAIYCWGANLVMNNSTLSGNLSPNGDALACDSDQQIYPSSVQLSNCILWDTGAEIWNNDNSTITITYSDVRGSWPGEGNIDADPCFVDAGFWGDANGPNAIWVDGDYHLLATSPCIDTGDPNYILEPNETDLDGNPRVIGARIDMGAYEYWPPVQAEMKLTPQSLNCASRGKYIKAHVTLPEGFWAEDVDVNHPAVAEPPGIESEYLKILGSGNSPVKLEIGFDRQEFCDCVAETGQIEVTVSGYLTTGQPFIATDTVKIGGRGRR